jgi:hypothetical protein
MARCLPPWEVWAKALWFILDGWGGLVLEGAKSSPISQMKLAPAAGFDEVHPNFKRWASNRLTKLEAGLTLRESNPIFHSSLRGCETEDAHARATALLGLWIWTLATSV